MDFSARKASVWVRPDEEEPVPASGSANGVEIKRSSTVKNRHLHPCNNSPRTGKAAFVRKASDNEIDASSHVAKYFARADGKSPLKPLSLTTGASNGTAVQRNTTLSTIHVSPPKRVRLRKYHTEPFLIVLRDQLKKTTGIHPKTPEKNDNPFEPSDLPGVMSRPWLSPNVFSTNVFSKNPKLSPSFKWSIDHMAALHPVEIDEHDILRTEYLKHVQTESDEDDAQENIRKFFSEKGDVHLPSPQSRHGSPSKWSPNSATGQRMQFGSPSKWSPNSATGGFGSPSKWSPTSATMEKRTQSRFGSPLKWSLTSATMVEEGEEYTKTHPTKNVEKKDVSCQTDIHMSPNFNFEKYFADYQMTQQFRRVSSSSENVRRRLFSSMDTSSTNLSWSPDVNTSTGFIFNSVSSQQVSSGFGDDNSADCEFERSDSL